MRLDLLTNATVVDDAFRFVCSNKSKTSSFKSAPDTMESSQPDYDEDESQL